MRTYTEHIAFQISRVLNVKNRGRVLITGGGVHNEFLMERIKALTKLDIEIMDAKTINFEGSIDICIPWCFARS